VGEVLQGPWGDAPRSRSPQAEPSTTPTGEPAQSPAQQESPPPVPVSAWAVPGVDPQASPVDESPVDADEPVPLPTSAGSRRAQNVSLAALTSHDASEAELRARLTKKGLEPVDVEAEIVRLSRAGLVDDRALADRLIERLRDRKGLGDTALSAALRQRLIPPAVVEAAIADAAQDPEARQGRLQQVAEDRARRLAGLAPDVAERRLLAYLQRKGYSGADARAAARSALQPR
jgi:regulatory protein